MTTETKFSDLVGQVITEIRVESDRVTFCTRESEDRRSETRKYVMYHSQDCCESVDIHDISGDLRDLIDTKVLSAEERTNSEQHPIDYVPDYSHESYMWTFYRIQTIKGLVVIRWLGTSNGYYSERVSFERTGA